MRLLLHDTQKKTEIVIIHISDCKYQFQSNVNLLLHIIMQSTATTILLYEIYETTRRTVPKSKTNVNIFISINKKKHGTIFSNIRISRTISAIYTNPKDNL